MGNFATAFTLFKGFVGAGILFLPNGFYEAGWLFGIIAMLISCTITFYFIYLLIKVKYEVGGTYGDIGYKAWGRFGRIITNLAITVAQFGFTCAYVVFIAQNIRKIIADHAYDSIEK